jgi:four helix bundle protein
MHDGIKCFNDFKIWRKGLELAEEVQKVIDDLPIRDSDDSLNSLRKATLSVPAYLAEGFMMGNSRDTKIHFYGALNSLEELRKGLAITEQREDLFGARISKIKSEISELNSMISELIRPV